MTGRVRQEWARRVAAEYGSAGITAQVLTWSVQAGLPPELLYTATRIVRDELDHARLSHQVLVALGGAEAPVALQADELAIGGTLPDVLVRNFCLGESFAVPTFERMRRRATHPAVRPVLDRILEDEAVHRAFGWDALDALLELAPTLREHVGIALPGHLATFAGYANPPSAPALTDDERACGLLDNAEYAELYHSTWTLDIAPRFARRGMAIG